MKKYSLPVIFLVTLCMVSGFISVLQAADIAYIEGKVEVQPAVDKVWKKADVGMQVNIGDSIRTARSSKADIVLDKAKKHSIRIEEKTLVILNSTSADQINKLDLSEGKIYANVEQMMAGLSFEVTTPSAVAGVRGTGWGVDSSPRGDEMSAFKDSIFVKTYDANKNLISDLIVTEGLKTLVERFGAAGALTELTAGEIRQWNEVRQDLSRRVGEGAAKKDETQQAQEAVELTEEEIAKAKKQLDEHGTEEDFDKIREGYTP